MSRFSVCPVRPDSQRFAYINRADPDTLVEYGAYPISYRGKHENVFTFDQPLDKREAVKVIATKMQEYLNRPLTREVFDLIKDDLADRFRIPDFDSLPAGITIGKLVFDDAASVNLFLLNGDVLHFLVQRV